MKKPKLEFVLGKETKLKRGDFIFYHGSGCVSFARDHKNGYRVGLNPEGDDKFLIEGLTEAGFHSLVRIIAAFYGFSPKRYKTLSQFPAFQFV